VEPRGTNRAAVFHAYNYREIRTPILEETQLFARGVGAETDIVTKEMYTFEDRDGSSLTMRPENTAGVMRAYIEHRLDLLPGVQKLYYIGPMFRRERPQKGRFRQFYQIGAEAIGSESPATDAEVIQMVVEILARSGLSHFELLINSVGCGKCRAQYIEKLREALQPFIPQLSPDNQRRAETNPLRVLDSKVPEDEPIIEQLPSILDSLCPECLEHFERVRLYLTDRGIKFEVKPRLVRGSTTICAPRLKWCMATSARRIPCSAAAVMTASRSSSIRKCLRRHWFFHRRRSVSDGGERQPVARCVGPLYCPDG